MIFSGVKLKMALLFVLIADATLCRAARATTIVAVDFANSRTVNYALKKLDEVSATYGSSLVKKSLGYKNIANVVVLSQNDGLAHSLMPAGEKQLAAEGFLIVRNAGKIVVIGADEN